MQVPIHTFSEDMALGLGYYLLSLGQQVHASYSFNSIVFVDPFSIVGDFSLSERSFGLTPLLEHYGVNATSIGTSLLNSAFLKLTSE